MRLPPLCLWICCTACGGTAHPTAQPGLPAFVNVEFRSALIAPTKTDGAPWDGLGAPAPPGLGMAIGNALEMTNAYAALTDVLAGPLIHGIERPEPFGTASVRASGVAGQEIRLTTAVRDTLTPVWDRAVITHVPLVEETVVEVRLFDRDLSEHDAIGDCNIRYEDLLAAFKARDVHQVRVAEQTARQLLFLGISVYRAD